MSRCQFKGPGGSHVDKNGWCLNEATRETDARALEKPEDKLKLCEEHHQFVKQYFLGQAAARA